MEKTDFQVRSAYLATSEATIGKHLSCYKFGSLDNPSNFLFYLLESNSYEKDLAINNRIIKTIEGFIKKDETLSYDLFEKIIEKLNTQIKILFEEKQIRADGLNAVLGLVVKDEIHFTQHGKILGYIFRKNQISTIIDKQCQNADLKVFSEVVSGQIAPSDQLVFGNEKLFFQISLDRLRTILKHKEPSLEILELAESLKKQKTKDANAVFISVLPNDYPLKPDLKDVIYIDEYNEKLKEFVKKQLIPFSQKTWHQTKKVSKLIANKSKILASDSKQKWQSNYGPKTKEFLVKSSNEFSKTLNSSKSKLEPKLSQIKNSESLRNFKLKNVSFYNKRDSIFKTKMDDFLQAISNLRVLLKKENRKYLYLVVILFVFLFGFFQILDNNNKGDEIAQKIETENRFQDSKTIFEKERDNIALGKTADYEKLNELLSFFKEAQNNESNHNEATAIIKEIKTVLDQQTVTKRFFESESFDFPLEKGKIFLQGTDIYGIDSDGKVYLGDPGSKETRLIAGIDQEMGQVVDLDYQDSLKKLLIATTKGFVLAFDPEARAYTKIEVEGETDWGNAQAIATYSSNIYILNSEAGKVWKHSKSGDKYLGGTSSIEANNSAIRGSIDIAIDGSIYLLENSGQISKYTKGTKDESFTSHGIPEPTSKVLIPSKLFVSENTNYLYLLDKKENRIIRFDKSGNFINQYTFDNIEISDFVVNERVSKIWAYADKKLFEGDL